MNSVQTIEFWEKSFKTGASHWKTCLKSRTLIKTDAPNLWPSWSHASERKRSYEFFRWECRIFSPPPKKNQSNLQTWSFEHKQCVGSLYTRGHLPNVNKVTDSWVPSESQILKSAHVEFCLGAGEANFQDRWRDQPADCTILQRVDSLQQRPPGWIWTE